MVLSADLNNLKCKLMLSKIWKQQLWEEEEETSRQPKQTPVMEVRTQTRRKKDKKEHIKQKEEEA